jgi:HK97 family phage prohead protease
VIERRFSNGLQLRVIDMGIASNSPGAIGGYSALYSTPGGRQNLSGDLGGFRERLAKNCFFNSLRNNDDIYALWNHQPSAPLGRVANGTLKLRSDDTGLHMQVQLPDTSYARDLYASVSRGDVSSQSFGFQCLDQGWDEEIDPDDRTKTIKVRTVKAAKLLEVSPCTFPAYDATSVSSIDPKIMGRSFESFFPEGLPMEIRSRFPNARQIFEQSRDRRRRLTDRVLAL